MGTPDFAVAPLDKLLQAGARVVAVITAPDRPAGRGKKIRFSAVKEYMLQNRPQIPLLQPTNLKDPAFAEELRSFAPDLQIVVAFRMLPELIWRIPEKGTFNLHASLLPQYRGAAPINWAIINGEKETGLSTFFIDEKIPSETRWKTPLLVSRGSILWVCGYRMDERFRVTEDTHRILRATIRKGTVP
jgi:methionyl-tRNA formyltransferase